MNRVPARLAGGQVQLLGTGRPVAGATLPDGEVVALIRPEALLVTADPAGSGQVVTRTFSGASTRILVALPDGTEVRVDLASADSGELTPGTSVTVRPADRPVLVVPAEPQEGTEPHPRE
jgi:putative spermidine/putrescine transport system ATP-binding protein